MEVKKDMNGNYTPSCFSTKHGILKNDPLIYMQGMFWCLERNGANTH